MDKFDILPLLADIIMSWNTTESERLISTLMAIQRPDIMRHFLDDLLTKSEIETCTKRLTAAYHLSLGAPYGHIEQTTGLSSATVARIAKQVYDRKGGYSTAFKLLNPHGRRYFD